MNTKILIAIGVGLVIMAMTKKKATASPSIDSVESFTDEFGGVHYSDGRVYEDGQLLGYEDPWGATGFFTKTSAIGPIVQVG